MSQTNTIYCYADASRVQALLSEIDMPQAAAEIILNYIETYDFSRLENAFVKLGNVATGDAAEKELQALIKDDERDGFLALTVYMIAALRSREEYEKRGIPRQIYTDTMKIFARFVREHMASYERYGYDRCFWTYRQLALNLFRLGVLEFEMLPLGERAARIGMAGQESVPALSVHIPSDAVMTREALDDSYRQAAEFFPQYFGYDFQHVYCDTWLLAPPLREILKPGSRILNFQEDYEILHADTEQESCVGWIFKKKYDDYNDLPETTSLARAVKARLLSGGSIGSAVGVIRDFVRKFGT